MYICNGYNCRDERFFKGVLIQATHGKYGNWLLLAAHLKRIVNALFAYAKENYIDEDWSRLCFPDSNSIAKWLSLSSGSSSAASDLLMTPRTQSTGRLNLMVLGYLILRVWWLQGEQSTEVVPREVRDKLLVVFQNIDNELEVERTYEPQKDDIEGLVVRVEEALSVLENSIDSPMVAQLQKELEEKNRQIEELYQLLEKRIVITEVTEKKEIPAQNIVLNEWFDAKPNRDHSVETFPKTSDSSVLATVSTTSTGVECTELCIKPEEIDQYVECETNRLDFERERDALQKEHRLISTAWYRLGQELMKQKANYIQ